jgi:hypothetical protein
MQHLSFEISNLKSEPFALFFTLLSKTESIL